MSPIRYVTVETPDPAAAEAFYKAAFDLGDMVRTRHSETPTSGFRGFTLSLVVPQPSTVDSFVRTALEAGAATLKEPKKSMWGYGGSLQSPDGTVWTIATSSKKETGAPERQIDELVLLIGPSDVAATKQFYADRGLTVDKSYGRKYVEFDAKGGAVKFALNSRKLLAKNAGIADEGSGSHRIVVGGEAGAFTDPDGFVWERAD